MLEIGTKFSSEEKLWYGPQLKPLFNPKVSLGQVIIRMLSMHGPKIAQISDDFGVETTFNDILMKTIRAAQNLQKLNIEPKSVIGIVANNSPDLAPILFASLCLGCPVSPVDPTFAKSELKSVINITRPNVFFCDVNVYDLLSACLRDLDIKAKVFTFTGQRGKSIAVEQLFAETQVESEFLPVDVDGENETAIIAGSYGISGTFEGIRLSHALLLEKCTRLSSIASGDILFAFSTIYWLSGVANLLKATYFGATRIITTKPFDPEYLLELIGKYRITHLFAKLSQITLAMKLPRIESSDLSSVKSVIFGKDASIEDYQAIVKYFKNATPYSMFGHAELAGAVSVSRGYQLGMHGSGKLVNGIQVKIVDENGNRLGISERGRICVKSDFLFSGYYGKEEDRSIVDQESFLITGDIGYFDIDGYMHVLGREVDMIKYQNVQIAPKEMEQILTRNSAIKSVCVIGIKSENEYLIAALIIRNKNKSISTDEVHNLITENFDDSHKLRGGVYFVSELPSTPSGKVIRRLAKGIAEKEFGSRNNAPQPT